MNTNRQWKDARLIVPALSFVSLAIFTIGLLFIFRDRPTIDPPLATAPSRPPVPKPLDADADRIIAKDHNKTAGSWDSTIRFYGKVIDQNNEPVEGVKIVATVPTMRVIPQPDGTWSTSSGLEAVSGADGRFTLEGARGMYLCFHEVVKPGYVLPHELQSLDSGMQKFSYDYFGSTPDKPPFKPDPEKPEIIKLWKLANPEPLILGSYCLQATLAEGRGLYEIGEERCKDEKRADITMEAREFNEGGKKGWEVVFTVPDGGIALPANDDPFMFTAPAEGYQKEWKFRFTREDCNEHTLGIPLRFFLKCRGGTYHGRITGDINKPNWKNRVQFNLHCAINPSGSRNLEFDFSNMLISPR